MTDHLTNPTWETLAEFYDEDERRRFSPEEDYGKAWMMEERAPLYRLSYLTATGEVVMTNQDTGWTELLGWAPNESAVTKVFKDWPARQGSLKSYYWCRKQMMVASGHHGTQPRKGNVHSGAEVTNDLRDDVTAPTSLF
jgi:hypothetical protein